MKLEWKFLSSALDLNLAKTLLSGQAFRWKHINNEFISTFHKDLVRLRERDGNIEYCSESGLLDDYFQLKIDLKQLYLLWSKDKNFAKKCVGFEGIRVLRQDPFENILCFICSSNNNIKVPFLLIKRIEMMISKLCTKFGNLVEKIEDLDTGDTIEFYSFPTLESLVAHPDLEEELRAMGFGYRAKYIAKTVLILKDKPATYFDDLRKLPYLECRQELLTLSGVGPKVADCICLFSMDKTDVIPVDTHVWQIATRDYKLNIKTLNQKTYQDVGEAFRKVFGQYAGWAHSVLFAADLVNPGFEVSEPKTKRMKIEM